MVYDAFNRYEKVYVPDIIKVDKTSLEHYQYIKTIKAGSSFGHILHCGDDFMMCLRKDDTIPVEEKIMEPIGFKRKSIEELEKLAETLNVAYKRDLKRITLNNLKNYAKIVEPAPMNTFIFWTERMKDKYLINTATGKEVYLGKVKKYILQETGLTAMMLNLILKEGIEIRNWCYKGKRIDGKDWNVYLAEKNHHIKSNPDYYNICFKKDDIVIYLKSIRQSATQLGVSHETLRKALKNNEQSVNGYSIERYKPEQE